MATTKANELGQFGSKLTVHNENITLDGTVHGQYAGFDSDINASSIGDLSNVDITTSAPSNNQSLIWDNANSKFVPGDSFSQSDFNTAFGNKSTSDLSEGTNEYHTTARARGAISATGSLSYNSTSGVMSFTQGNTDTISEGSSNLYYTDARADARVALVVDAAPSTLNTLNELAAALGDDANFSTTVTNSIATKLPLAGGTMTGNLSFGDNDKAIFGAGSDLQIYHDGSASYVSDQGSGPLNVLASQLNIYNATETSQLAQFNTTSSKLFHNNAVKLATTSYGIDITGRLVTTSHIDAPDNARIRLGDGDDLQLYHDGSNSRIDDAGTGDLIIRGSSAIYIGKYTGENMAVFNADGAVDLRYNNDVKFVTTNSGINVTGDITLGDTNPQITFNDSSTANLQHLIVSSSDKLLLSADHNNVDAGTKIEFAVDGTERMEVNSTGIDVTGTVTADGLTVDGDATVTANLPTFTITGQGRVNGFEIAGTSGDTTLTEKSNNGITLGTNNTSRLRIQNNGDISFYEDTGTTAKFFWDASGERLVLGTTENAPVGTLTIKTDTNGRAIHIEENSGGESYQIGVDVDGDLGFYNSGALTASVTFDDSGNVLVGTTSYTGNTANSGGGIRNDGLVFGSVNSGSAAVLNRTSTDGDIAVFRKDGSTVGSIGIQSSGFIIDGEASHSGLRFTAAGITPRLNKAESNNTVSLGESGIRFKDLFLSGNITVSGTVDGRDVATDGTKLDTIETNATADQTKADIEGLGIDVPAGNLTGTIAAARLSTATTQAESDDSTKIATTAYVTDKITTLIGGAPSTLNDLNELAAAINDDANYNSTLTTALGTKLPKSGGTMTGNLNISIPDNGGAPANAAILGIRGYEGRGAGITIRDQANSASGSSDREWFVGSGYNQSAFNIGYSSTATQTSYSAQSKLTIKSNGNVGIGTSNPGAMLEILSDGSNNDGAEVLLKHANNNTSDIISTIKFANNSGPAAMIQAGTTGANNSGYIDFFTDNTGSSSRVARMTPNGRVGIGTDDPGFKLDVEGTTRVTSMSSSPGSGAGLEIRYNTGGSWGGLLSYDRGGAGYQELRLEGSIIKLIESGEATPTLTVNNSNVGIGTTSPSQTLHLESSSSRVLIKSTAADEASMNFNTPSGNTYIGLAGLNGELFSGSAAGDFVISNRSGGDIHLTADTGFAESHFTIIENGNVGIGTTGPDKKFHVHSANQSDIVKFENDNGAFVLGKTSNLGSLDMASDANFRIRHGGTVSATFKSNGNVGIGDTNPGYKLSVNNGTSDGAIFRLYNEEVGLYVAVDGTTGSPNYTNSSRTVTFNATRMDSGSSPKLRLGGQGGLEFAADANNVRMVINTAGNVGIGTTSPSAIFQVGSSTGGNFIVSNDATNTSNRHNNTNYIASFQRDANAFVLISSGNNTSNAGISFMGSGDRGSVYGTSSYDIHIEPNCQYGQGDVIIKGRNDSTNKTRVGMGVAPYANTKLTLGGTDSVGYPSVLMFDNNNSSGAEFFMLATDTNWTAGANKFVMGHGAPGSGNVDVTIDSSGQVGIGTYNPTERLHVSGNILATGNVTANSDISLKDNITPIPDALDKVLQIRGVTFNRNDIEDNPRHAGVIAQEVEKVLPEVVSEGKDGIKSVAYGNMVSLLIEAIKEQQEQINMLKEKLESK